jgi:hypothetical protein
MIAIQVKQFPRAFAFAGGIACATARILVDLFWHCLSIGSNCDPFLEFRACAARQSISMDKGENQRHISPERGANRLSF